MKGSLARKPCLAGGAAAGCENGGGVGDASPPRVVANWMRGRGGGGPFSIRSLRIAATLLRLIQPRKHACRGTRTSLQRNSLLRNIEKRCTEACGDECARSRLPGVGATAMQEEAVEAMRGDQKQDLDVDGGAGAGYGDNLHLPQAAVLVREGLRRRVTT